MPKPKHQEGKAYWLFHKASPNVPITLSTGKKAGNQIFFTKVTYEDGTFATQDEEVGAELKSLADQGRGGVTVLTEPAFHAWQKKRLTRLPPRSREEFSRMDVDEKIKAHLAFQPASQNPNGEAPAAVVAVKPTPPPAPESTAGESNPWPIDPLTGQPAKRGAFGRPAFQKPKPAPALPSTTTKAAA